MPGEAANSRYDRPLGTLKSQKQNGSQPTFDWGGNATGTALALRLPGGVKAAERLSTPVARPRGLWFEREGMDVEALSRGWTRLWAVVVFVTVVVLIADAL